LIHPLTLGQVAHYHDLGLRERVLSLPVMVALVLSMVWRQVGAAGIGRRADGVEQSQQLLDRGGGQAIADAHRLGAAGYDVLHRVRRVLDHLLKV